MKNKLVWKTISSKLVHKNPWYQVFKDKVVRPDGAKGIYHVVKTQGPSVFVAAVNSKREVCLVKIHRYPTHQISFEIPGGNSEGQNLLTAAKRELREETGLSAKSWKRAGAWHPINGICGEVAHVFIATGLSKTENRNAVSEGISETQFLPYKKVLKMIREGEIMDGQTIGGIFLAGFKLGWLKF
jgi:8-oxo-dGTP pyrophosphatase MutT (NUDIX family)